MWDWLDDVVDWGGDAIDTVSDWWGDTDIIDDVGGLLTGVSGSDAAPWLDLGKTLYGGYRAGEAQDDYLARMQPLQDYYSRMIPQMEAYYDPVASRKGIRGEFERRKGLLTPYWEETDQARRARAAQAGMTGSSTFGKQQAQTEAERAKLLSGTILPQAEQAYYAQPQQMMTQMGNVGSLMSGQPMMQPTYQAAQRSPFETYFDTLLAKSL